MLIGVRGILLIGVRVYAGEGYIDVRSTAADP